MQEAKCINCFASVTCHRRGALTSVGRKQDAKEQEDDRSHVGNTSPVKVSPTEL
jgi:hypothetical protein